MATATIKLIEAVERLNMTGEIGDGMVANLHDLASMARLEQVEISEAIAMTIAAIKPHVERAERFKAATGKAVEGARVLYGNARIVAREGAEGLHRRTYSDSGSYCAPCHQTKDAPGFAGCSRQGCPIA